jgi:hypothetical protein
MVQSKVRKSWTILSQYLTLINPHHSQPVKSTKKLPYSGSFSSGDGGNRTRVRKNRPSDIYECSQLIQSRLRLASQLGDPLASC